MGTLSPRGRHSEVASTTSDDEVKADWPAGGQRPGIPQEEAENEEAENEEEENEEAENEEGANEEAANEEEGAAIENGGATSEEKGGGNGFIMFHSSDRIITKAFNKATCCPVIEGEEFVKKKVLQIDDLYSKIKGLI
ncbi:hypothetical protein NDU88_000762 [Pleurodeles waltl]|uniref:Uncharacterized protein n=1 Tax=Pleurodeles waltl TaxID=8319 RepID=A0AAV7S7X3_PLEWA|nr:hypothetical protein NDU88_000762 [Pleurodeles waltl]